MVPRLLLVPAWRSSLIGRPQLKSISQVWPSRQISTLNSCAERVDAAHAHAVQAAGNLVGGGVEFAAGMQLGQHHLHRGHHLAVADRHHVHGNAAAVVDDGDGVVDVDDDFDLLGVAGQGLVDGVVDHLVDQVVQAHFAGRADVHGRTQAHRLQAFEDLDVFAGVAAVVAVCVGEGLVRCSIAIVLVAIEFNSQGFRSALHK